ncbi:MAG: hypothetical protein UCO57_09800 [Gemmiger sp.]|nr:hypothetical protein [Gemmiger sp.]MEE0709057.1 hypothetical protein [Gemmiger sp.]
MEHFLQSKTAVVGSRTDIRTEIIQAIQGVHIDIAPKHVSGGKDSGDGHEQHRIEKILLA